MKLEIIEWIFKKKKNSHFNINENPSSGSQAVPYRWMNGWTDQQT